MKTFSDEIYQKRQSELSNRMVESNCDLYFCPPSSDLEYFTGTLRRKPTFGNISYAHGWVCGAFFRPFKSPLFVLPRMVAEFDMPHGATGEKIIISETDDGDAIFEKVIKDFGKLKKIAVEQRTWAETTLKINEYSKAIVQNGISLTNPMRRKKTDEEIAIIKEACMLADVSMDKITNTVVEAEDEKEIHVF